MWNPWTIGIGVLALHGALGLGGRVAASRGMKRLHAFGLMPIAAWTIVGAVSVVWADDTRFFDQGMAVGLLLLVGLQGYASPKKGDPGWAIAVHGLVGIVVLAWYVVMAHRFGGILPG